MIKDEILKHAVSRLQQRSERQETVEKLLNAFVDNGILPQLINKNNQVIFGRRGTGKTHILRVLATKLSEDKKNIVVYIDARTLGSTSQFSDASIAMPSRCLALFRDVISELYSPLLEYIVDSPAKDADRAMELLDVVMKAGLEKIENVEKTKVMEKKSGSLEVAASLGLSTVGLTPSLAGQKKAEAEDTATYQYAYEDKVVFPVLQRALAALLNELDVNLYVLFDEWASLPSEVQPFLAEFLKRGVLPVSKVTLKIASLEYRSRFFIRGEGGGYTGFELGADVSAAQDLDDYYVYDKNPEAISTLFSDMLLRHLNTELPEGYLADKFNIHTGSELASKLFTERATFQELARAAEGVARDLINIFGTSYFYSHRRNRDTIDKKSVTEAARQWFEQDKSKSLDDQLHGVLRRVVDEVIGRKKAKSFLLPRHLEGSPILHRLVDARVLHHIQRGYADKDNPGVRYNIYTLDYGTYVDLLGTSKEPDIELFVNSPVEDKEFVVPFDDKRSIRRIVLPEDIFN